MAPVAKSNHNMTLSESEKGQISIFFSASLVVLISIIAFVINVGLFVKAKINLQNATDAAAFSGAAVQARQLSKIAYLNWEMRNIYKEWMYKYYVIGNLNVPDVESPGSDPNMNFRLEPDVNPITHKISKDPFNFPAVCIHIADSKTNVCKRYSVPGLPEFGGYSIPGSEEASRAFMDTLIGSKINDCVMRSKLNMLVATTWAYNVLNDKGASDTLAGRGPAILSDRQGAWPKAIELAMRIRNLEYVMNAKAVTEGVCYKGGYGIPCTDIKTYEGKKLGNERIVKAFYSAFRNLGNETAREMKDSFVLTEIPPRKTIIDNKANNSNLLIPQPYEKQWVDLKLMMVNYATFYAALIPRADSETSGACDISKVAIPIPGYPLGFYKNPSLVTYYAVRGEAEFEGMFNPFKMDRIKLSAYAAAKPFGGRIGPMLFHQKQGSDFTQPRDTGSKLRSVPYIASISVVGTENPYLLGDHKVKAGEYGPGNPLPMDLTGQPFWIENSHSPIGGLATDSTVQFGLPNMVYDFIGGSMDPTRYAPGGTSLYKIDSSLGEAGDAAVGLFATEQFKAFRGTSTSGSVTVDQLKAEIARVRAPTLYEAANYMIPTPFDLNINLGVDSFGFSGAQPDGTGDVSTYSAKIYAPLYRGANDQEDLLWGSPNDVVSTISEFMNQQHTGIQNYIRSLNKAAVEVYKMKDRMSAAASKSVDKYIAAGNGISDIGVDTNPDIMSSFPQSCNSLAGQFYGFYYGHDPSKFANIRDHKGCPTPLGQLLEEYFAASAADKQYHPLYYSMEYSFKKSNFSDPLKVYTAYMPGPFNGVSDDGILEPPFRGLHQETMRRNFYSTKFVTLDSLRSGTTRNYDEQSNFAIMSEGALRTESSFNTAQGTWSNPLEPGSAGIGTDVLNKIKH